LNPVKRSYNKYYVTKYAVLCCLFVVVFVFRILSLLLCACFLLIGAQRIVFIITCSQKSNAFRHKSDKRLWNLLLSLTTAYMLWFDWVFEHWLFELWLFEHGASWTTGC